jgi:hypothetical protein
MVVAHRLIKQILEGKFAYLRVVLTVLAVYCMCLESILSLGMENPIGILICIKLI